MKYKKTEMRKYLYLTVSVLLLCAAISVADTLTAKESLGKFLFFDKISSPDSMSLTTQRLLAAWIFSFSSICEHQLLCEKSHINIIEHGKL